MIKQTAELSVHFPSLAKLSVASFLAQSSKVTELPSGIFCNSCFVISIQAAVTTDIHFDPNAVQRCSTGLSCIYPAPHQDHVIIQ